MSHCCCAVISYCDEEEELLNHYVEHGIDYYNLFEDDECNKSWYPGLILKDGKENEYMYIARDGNKYAYKAFIVDVDWEKTFAVNSIEMFIDYRMMIDKYDFYDYEKKECKTDEFFKFFDNRLQNAEMITLVDAHN
jgi:hypothetical protein